MSIISYMSDIPAENYERVFGKKKRDIKIDHITKNPEDTTPKSTTVNLVDDDGKIIRKVTSFHKNKIYRQAKQLREDLKHELCTKSECWNPTDSNIKKMITNEMKNPKTKAYQMAMQAIGADPEDCSTEKLRR